MHINFSDCRLERWKQNSTWSIGFIQHRDISWSRLTLLNKKKIYVCIFYYFSHVKTVSKSYMWLFLEVYTRPLLLNSIFVFCTLYWTYRSWNVFYVQRSADLFAIWMHCLLRLHCETGRCPMSTLARFDLTIGFCVRLTLIRVSFPWVQNKILA